MPVDQAAMRSFDLRKGKSDGVTKVAFGLRLFAIAAPLDRRCLRNTEFHRAERRSDAQRIRHRRGTGDYSMEKCDLVLTSGGYFPGTKNIPIKPVIWLVTLIASVSNFFRLPTVETRRLVEQYRATLRDAA
jgi:hypothetical protein